MMIRTIISSIIAFASIFYVIFETGEAQYGIYAGALGVFNFIDLLLKSEIRLHLLKFSPNDNRDQFSSAFTLLLITSIIISIIILSSLIFISESHWLIEKYRSAFLVFFVFLPISVTSEIPRAILESRSEFKKIAIDEFISVLLQYFIVIFWTFHMEDWRGLLYGWVAYQLLLSLLTWLRSKYLPYFRFNRVEWKKLVNHSYELSLQNILKQAQHLINPLIVGYFMGTAGVGIVSFAEKIVYGFSFFRDTLYRISASVLSKIDPDEDQFHRFIRKGVFLQILPLGVLLLIAGIVVYMISKWSTNEIWKWVNLLYPFFAIGYFFNTIFSIPILSLQIYNRNKEVLTFLFFKFLVFVVLVIILVKNFGIIGYGLAEFFSISLFYFICKKISINSLITFTNNTQILMICIPIALMWPYVGWLSSISLLIVPLLPKLITDYKQLFQSIRNS